MKRVLTVLCCMLFLFAGSKAKAQNVTASSFQFISSLGAKCLDIELGRLAAGSRVILWDCGVGKQNQMFQFMMNGQIRAANTSLCIDDHGGLYHSMDQIELWPCAQSSSRWRFTRGQILSPNGMCLDLRGGAAHWYLGNQDAILFACNGQPQQHFVVGITLPASRGTTGYAPGTQGSIDCHSGSCTFVVTANGIVAQGGGNIVSQGGGNIVSQGGGNIVSQGGGNVIVPVGTTAQ